MCLIIYSVVGCSDQYGGQSLNFVPCLPDSREEGWVLGGDGTEDWRSAYVHKPRGREHHSRHRASAVKSKLSVEMGKQLCSSWT